MIRFLCPHCLKRMKAPAEKVWKPVGCRECHKACLVPPEPDRRRVPALIVAGLACAVITMLSFNVTSRLLEERRADNGPPPGPPFTYLLKNALRWLLGL